MAVGAGAGVGVGGGSGVGDGVAVGTGTGVAVGRGVGVGSVPQASASSTARAMPAVASKDSRGKLKFIISPIRIWGACIAVSHIFLRPRFLLRFSAGANPASAVIDRWRGQPYTRQTISVSPPTALRRAPTARRPQHGGSRLEPLEVAQFIVDVASDKLAEDIVLLDLRDLAPFADYFVIMSAESSRQIEALEEDLTQALKDAGAARHRREGTPASGWVLLDFSDVIVHIFSPDEREFYDLERLWRRAPQVVRVL